MGIRVGQAPKPISKVDQAKLLEDFMYQHNLDLYQTKELLAIIEFARRDIR